MAKKKIYAAELSDGRKSLFGTWDECKAFIATCPSAAKFKGFPAREEAEAFLGLHETAPGPAPAENAVAPDTCVAEAYTDGSFNGNTQTWGYGVILYPQGHQEMAQEFSGCGTEHAAARNITGEIHGAVIAAENAARQGYRKLVIYHDYMGISEWATGRWKRNQELTQWYARRMSAIMADMEIEFRHVAGHTGVPGNERVDIIAKQACGVPC